MKKLLALVLAIILTIGMVVSATATSTDESVGSPVAETIAVPTVIMEEENGNIIIELTATEEAPELTEEQQKVFADAQDTLEEAAPEDMAAISFFYFEAFIEEENGDKTKITEPIDVTLDISEVSELEEITEVKVMQFVDGEWKELEVVMNPDGTITIKGVVEGPIAIFVK